MNNWERVESIFHSALALPVAERQPFLQNECGGNEELRSEVETLITSFEADSTFLNEPVFELGLSAIAKKAEKTLANTTVGSYEIEEKIGAGGMGEVYKAFDTQLNRHVALKFLSESLENDNAARRQLVKEAQAAAALEHPNICAVHGIEQIGKHHFIVMQYIEGITLSEKIAGEETITAEEFKFLARQILSAVALAHSHGVIHRDLKPGNIMLTNDGQIKVLDFGLAKIVASKQLVGKRNNTDTSIFSKKGLIIGTVCYMSPEQLRGEKLDFRSDIFSVGIILYEILTRQNPFNRPSQAETIAAILSETPPLNKAFLPDLSTNLSGLIEKCLHKNKDIRFQSVAEIIVELDNLENESRRMITGKRGGFFLKTILAVLVLIFFLTGFFLYNANRPKRTLAVLPISTENLPAEKEYLADGLTQSIIDELSGLSDLKVKNQAVTDSYKGKTIEPQNIGKELNVDAVLVGKIQKRGVDLILTTKLVRISNGFEMTPDESRIDEANLTEFSENLALLIVNKIKLNLTDEDKNKLAKKDTDNEEAKRLYFLGRYSLGRRATGDEKNALTYFQNAKELDPGFAKAWTGLADAYLAQCSPGVENSISPKEAANLARDAVKQALAIDDNLSEAYNSLGLINSKYDWDWVKAEANFQAAISRNPEFIPARSGLINVLIAQKRFGEALEQARIIKELAPASTTGDMETAKVYYMQHDFMQMEKVVNEVLSKNPLNDRLSQVQSYLFLNTGKYNEAISILEKKYQSEKSSEKIFAAAPLGFAYAKAGRRNDALKVIETLDLLAKKQYVAPQEKAFVYIGLGNFEKVFENLNQSCNERFYSLPFWVIDPVVDEIKSSPEFNKIKECVNL